MEYLIGSMFCFVMIWAVATMLDTFFCSIPTSLKCITDSLASIEAAGKRTEEVNKET